MAANTNTHQIRSFMYRHRGLSGLFFLKYLFKIDRYLLLHYPTLWVCQIHYIFHRSLFAILILNIIAFFTPLKSLLGGLLGAILVLIAILFLLFQTLSTGSHISRFNYQIAENNFKNNIVIFEILLYFTCFLVMMLPMLTVCLTLNYNLPAVDNIATMNITKIPDIQFLFFSLQDFIFFIQDNVRKILSFLPHWLNNKEFVLATFIVTSSIGAWIFFEFIRNVKAIALVMLVGYIPIFYSMLEEIEMGLIYAAIAIISLFFYSLYVILLKMRHIKLYKSFYDMVITLTPVFTCLFVYLIINLFTDMNFYTALSVSSVSYIIIIPYLNEQHLRLLSLPRK